MIKAIRSFVLILGLVLIVAGILIKTPGKEQTAYSFNSDDNTDIEEYVSGETHNYIAMLQLIAKENNDVGLIANEVLELNEALIGMTDAFDDVAIAKERYDDAISSGEEDANFKAMAKAFVMLNEQFVEGKTNSNAFWASAELLIGREKLRAWDYDINTIYEETRKNVNLFTDFESAGLGFLDRLYALSESGQVTDGSGNVIAKISKHSDGSYSIDIGHENIAAIADKMNLSREAVLSCLEAISMFGDIVFYDIEEVAKAIEELGVVTTVAEVKVGNSSALIDQLTLLDKSQREIDSVFKKLEKEAGVFFLDAEMEGDILVEKLSDCKLASKGDAEIEIEYASLATLMNDISFTQKQAEELVTKLSGINGVQFTNQLGSGSAGAKDFESVLDRIKSVVPSSTAGKLSDVTTAIQDKTDTLNGTSEKQITDASFIGGEIAGAKAQKAIFISFGALIICIGLLSFCKNNKKSEFPMDSHFIAQNDFNLEKADVDIAERTGITDETETDEKYTSTNRK